MSLLALFPLWRVVELRLINPSPKELKLVL